MASLAVMLAPVIAEAIPLLSPVIKNLVQEVEKLFGAKTGPQKLETVAAAAGQIANQLSTAGQLNGVLDPTALATIIESIVQALKAKGQLGVQPPAAIPAQISLSGTFTFTTEQKG